MTTAFNIIKMTSFLVIFHNFAVLGSLSILNNATHFPYISCINFGWFSSIAEIWISLYVRLYVRSYRLRDESNIDPAFNKLAGKLSFKQREWSHIRTNMQGWVWREVGGICRLKFTSTAWWWWGQPGLSQGEKLCNWAASAFCDGMHVIGLQWTSMNILVTITNYTRIRWTQGKILLHLQIEDFV